MRQIDEKKSANQRIEPEFMESGCGCFVSFYALLFGRAQRAQPRPVLKQCRNEGEATLLLPPELGPIVARKVGCESVEKCSEEFEFLQPKKENGQRDSKSLSAVLAEVETADLLVFDDSDGGAEEGPQSEDLGAGNAGGGQAERKRQEDVERIPSEGQCRQETPLAPVVLEKAHFERNEETRAEKLSPDCQGGIANRNAGGHYDHDQKSNVEPKPENNGKRGFTFKFSMKRNSISPANPRMSTGAAKYIESGRNGWKPSKWRKRDAGEARLKPKKIK